ncbi:MULTISPECIES: xanthine dehydrogenase family protein molybdopterin-binding subunit [Aminobacterium]|jgi:CO/xanthine dehydrogenase Mo-binding subunit|uniref:xanthine dehydrogenase family protein molybdopterin-binding subunit n=1 Tax=Aminobacterium TaxID=81466 RepID=UPI00257D816F|nr:molybdopterin cofactor-binding domain-containing protein [Aminobacterium sp. UBA4987]
MDKYDVIGHSLKKVDGLSLATGAGRYTDDWVVDEPLTIRLLYSSKAFAEIESIDTKEAEKIAGVVDILTFKNTPDTLFTTAGQGFPEPSPYDSRLFDSTVRYVGDRVAAVVAESEEQASEALQRIKVTYRDLSPNFDMESSTKGVGRGIHGKDAFSPISVPYFPEKNIAGQVDFAYGDLEKGYAESAYVIERTYTTPYVSHCAMEPHAVKATFDEKGRLIIISSTQVPFHARRIVSHVLSIPIRQIRVIKPRIGGGFGAKQEVFLEPLAALVALRHKRSVHLVLSRREVFISSRTRHPFRIKLRTGLKEDGQIVALEMDTLMNAGAYGPHALTVLSNAGSKVLPLLNKIPSVKFSGKSVYTNLPIAGAYRGYGATQGYFALNQHLDIITRETGQDILEYIKKWHIKEHETSAVFEALGEGQEGVTQVIKSCKLSECIDSGAAAIDWYNKRNKKIRPDKDSVRGVGVAAAMQGSGIPLVDMGSAYIKMNDDGSFLLFVGATDIGTGSDTVLSQIAAETLHVPLEHIQILSSDTDMTPFDVGAYASSTTYVSGGAVLRCAQDIAHQIIERGSMMMNCPTEELLLEKGCVIREKTGESLAYEEICRHSFYTSHQKQIQAGASFVSPQSPPPFIAQFAEVEVDTKTGKVKVVQLVSAVDCGQPLNPQLVEGQVEGAVVNGISFALTEELRFDKNGRVYNPTFWDYKIYTAADIPAIKTIIAESSDVDGPYGAKSVAEIGINGTAPAIANAIYDAVGVRLYDLPFTPEKVLVALKRHKRVIL